MGEINYYTPSVMDCPNQDTMNYVYWIHCEMMISASVSFACTAFMFLRFFTRPKLQTISEEERHMTTPQVDSLVAMMPLCHAFVNELAPLLVICFQLILNL